MDDAQPTAEFKGYFDSPKEGAFVLRRRPLRIAGWAVATVPIRAVRIWADDAPLGETERGISRPDVAQMIPGYPAADRSGFVLTTVLPETVAGQVQLRAEFETESGRRFELCVGINVEDLPGSDEEWSRLGYLNLPDLKNKSFLSIGPDAGFFCRVAQKEQARRVVGVDTELGRVRAARQRFPDLESIHSPERILPAGPFDVILHTGEINEPEYDPYLYIKRVYSRLADDGLFVLEVGIASDRHQAWEKVEQDGRTAYRATEALLRGDLLRAFSVRFEADSVPLPGRLRHRKVFHCRKYRPIVMLLAGRSRTGKTTLASELEHSGVPMFSADIFLSTLARNAGGNSGALWRAAAGRQVFEGFDEKIDGTDLGESFADELVAAIPKGHRVLVIDGEMLSYNRIRAAVIDRLKRAGFVVHVAP
jgi:SAM-dependent methyltransferase